MSHTYSKFKNKNIPYAKVGRRVFNSLFDAESFCTEHGLDVNSAIEYRDDPELKNNIQTIAQYQKAILQECLDRLKARAEALVQEINRCNADLEKCHPLDRGVSHEIVRHRMASYCQESTRYCNYGKGKFGEEITVIEPCFLEPGSRAYDYWRDACEGVEIRYFDMLAEGCTPQEARSVLPNSLKTEVVMTANIREWRHFLKLRCSPAAHPQMREVALILLDKVHWLIPVCFDDIWSEYHADV